MIVRTASGLVEGRLLDGAAVFLGIPYAQDPGAGFDPPRAPAPWDGVFPATAPGASAPHAPVAQELFPDPVVVGGNPLNLNVYAPADRGARVPVVVWLHGGGFFTGSNASPWYTGETFARDGVVLVVPNYRLAAEGFMILDDGVANRALLDLTAALRWVRDNIEAFGGDPDRVTVAGQSSGATAALALSGVPAARGLFHRLAVMSAGTPLLASLDRMRALSTEFAAQLGVPPTRAALARVPLERRLELETAWLPEEVQAPPAAVDDRARRTGKPAFRWQPTHDGEVVTTAPGEALAVPGALDALLIGVTAEEWNFMLGEVTPAPSTEACEEGFANLGLTPRDLRHYLRALRTGNPGHALAQALTDRTFRAPARDLAEVAAAAGIPVYAYQFGWQAPGLGAAHCTDLPFFFDHLQAPGVAGLLGPDAPPHLAAAMHDAFVRFARDGDAGWSAYDSAARRVMVFDDRMREVPGALSRMPRELRG
ncbi:carboxylesterase/lipase family protein [Amycolatopsis sacchari]|uniref:carboxylesterase/lipase family protein n=1 Tax=Amycolatopsis sacchari TaxID=115433 RepID=UPI003D74628F